MKTILTGMVIAGVVMGGVSRLYAAEHAGKEHAGTTQQTAVSVPPTNEEIRAAMKGYALLTTKTKGGSFPIFDDRIGKERKLTFQQVHQRVGKLSTRDGYFSCADFVDQASGEKLDVDFWVTVTEGKLEVTASEIHKVNDKPRFTYNGKDEKVMLE